MSDDPLNASDDQKPTETSPSRTRDHLANERTLLAWVRTSMAIIGLGFIVARFGLLLRELGTQIDICCRLACRRLSVWRSHSVACWSC
jgi:uncharacterized membrane protein YidH (DUF202 family)